MRRMRASEEVCKLRITLRCLVGYSQILKYLFRLWSVGPTWCDDYCQSGADYHIKRRAQDLDPNLREITLERLVPVFAK